MWEKFTKSARGNAIWKKNGGQVWWFIPFIPAETEAGGSPWIGGQPGLQVSFRSGRAVTKRNTLKKQNQISIVKRHLSLVSLLVHGKAALGMKSEAHLPPKLCLSEDKLGLGSEREGWALSRKAERFWMWISVCWSHPHADEGHQVAASRISCSAYASWETRRGTVWTWRKTKFYIFRNVRFP